MAFNVPKSGSAFTPLEPGLYSAVIDGIFDLGYQAREFQGKEQVPAQMLQLRFACVPLNQPNAEPRAFYPREYTLSFSKKGNLRKLIESVKGKTIDALGGEDKFDVESLAGSHVLLSIVNKTSATGKVRAEANSIMPAPAGTPAPAASPLLFHRAQSEENQRAGFERLPPFVQQKVRNQLDPDEAERIRARMFAEADALQKANASVAA